jgi:phosphatidylserine/phosphatidylglycerophosphate/cardiolipin synthase-like enzyme
MSDNCEGSIITDKTDPATGRGTVLPNYTVTLNSPPGSFKLASGKTDQNGHFSFDYRKDPMYDSKSRQIEVVVQDPIGREVYRGVETDRDNSAWLDLWYTTINDADARGFLVTLGTGQTSPSANTLPGWGLAESTVKFLIDNEQFQKAAELFNDARDFIYFSQLFFPLPTTYNTDATQETPKLIFDFHAPVPDTTNPRAAGVGDSRPERLLLQAADRDVDIRILMTELQWPLLVRILTNILTFSLTGSDGIFSSNQLLHFLRSGWTDALAVKEYFTEAGNSSIKVYPFKLPVVTDGVMHAKLMFVDGMRVLSIGSPFEQSYIDTHAHDIDAWVRGDWDTYPNHDVGFIAKGKVIEPIYDTLKLLWDNAAPTNEKLQDYAPTPPDSHHGASTIPDNDWDDDCTLQIVRTITAKRFDQHPDGEQGILEAYLRAINMAQRLIYFENQWLVSHAIGDAIVKAMQLKPDLQTILLLNIKPDTQVPFYPWRQRRLIHHMQQKLDPSRFGVFTRWSHKVGTDTLRPQLMPVYIHAKAGVVDDTWCTVGSANLDNYSMESAIELNAIILNGVDGARTSKLPDLLRRKLWAEHLNYIDSSGKLDINAADLVMPSDPTKADWLSLWTNHAKGNLSALINQPNQPLTANGDSHILPWPTDNSTHKYPRDYLTTLGIQSYRVIPLKGTRKFDFKKGDWKDTKYPMDYP